MIEYPRSAEERRALREKHMMRAVHGALRAGMSYRCSAGDHNTKTHKGCQNDGTSCLCWCHDQEALRGTS